MAEPARRVLFVAGTLGVGGAEQQLFYMARVLVARGHHLKVVALEGGPFAERLRDIGVEVTVLGPTLTPFGRVIQLARAVRTEQPDIVQASHNWVSGYVAAVGRMLRVPAIGALRSEPASTIEEVGLLGHLSLRLPKLIAANSVAAIDASVDMGVDRSKLFHLPNAVDTEKFHPSEPVESPGEPPVTMMAIGRLTWRKRFDIYLDVVAELLASTGGAEAAALLVGSGPDRAQLEAQANRLGLTDRLQFIETDDPAEIYRRADIMLFTAGPSEGTPNVIIEAMASGVVVVAFDSGDVRRLVIDNVTGRLVEPSGDVQAMVTAVRDLLVNRSVRKSMAMKAHAHVLSHHSLEALGGNLDQLHHSALTS